jgi:hypothetical protein
MPWPPSMEGDAPSMAMDLAFHGRGSHLPCPHRVPACTRVQGRATAWATGRGRVGRGDACKRAAAHAGEGVRAWWGHGKAGWTPSLVTYGVVPNILHIIVISFVPFIYFIQIFYSRRNARALTIVFTPPVARALSLLEARNLCSVASHGHLPS